VDPALLLERIRHRLTIFTFLVSSLCLVIVACNGKTKAIQPLQGGGEPIVSSSGPSIPWVRNDPANKSVIVFVHGVLGNALTTWSDGTHYWPTMLKTDSTFDGQNIYVYDYPSPALGGSLSVDQLADNMRLALSTDGVFKHSSIIFVSHSMGGLITRAFILKYRAAVASKIRFLYFFATPTTGSPYAKLAVFASKNPQFGQLYPMDAADSYVSTVQSDWLAADLQLKSYCAYETRPLYGQFLIVEQQSATNLCTQHLDPIDANHLTIVKPSSSSSDSYRALKEATQETQILTTANPEPPRPHPVTIGNQTQGPTQAATYIASISRESDPEARAALVEGLDIAVPPSMAVTTAMHYAAAKDWSVSPQEKAVFDAAIRVLKRLKVPGHQALLDIQHGNSMPDADIAAAILGAKAKVNVRVSSIDDFGDLTINGILTVKRFGFQQDSGWLDVTSKLALDQVNDLKLMITNGPAGGFGGRLQISAGTEQYDSGIIAQNRCPCDAPAFDIDSKINPSASGAVRIFETKINYY
jgi:pimeloyl-ACP methyl ester carboxylesterase